MENQARLKDDQADVVDARPMASTTSNEDAPNLIPEDSGTGAANTSALDGSESATLHVETKAHVPFEAGIPIAAGGQDPMNMSTSILSAVDDSSVGLPTTTLVPGPLREEPTLKEKLVDRERQRRKEAERGRLKRQFALMSNGGGLVYDNLNGPASNTGGPLRENGSITGTVGEESSVAAHADLDDSMSLGLGMAMMPPHHGGNSHPHHHHHGRHHQTQDQSSSPPALGYTMERFLQERDNTNSANNNNSNVAAAATPANNSISNAHSMSQAESAAIATVMTSMIREEEEPDKGVVMERFLNDKVNTTTPVSQAHAAAVATVMASSNTIIREEAIESDPKTSGAPDKGVVMERFLKEPVVVDATPPASTNMQDDPSTNRADDVHRSVSFDIDLQAAQQQQRAASGSTNNPTSSTGVVDVEVDDMHNLDSNASVQVEVAPEDNHHLVEPPSPGGGLSIPSVVAPSSIATDDQHHRRQETETSLGSGGPSIDRQSSTDRRNLNDDDDDTTDDEPRLFRLTEAEIQEMAAIEEASIGNAPPSERDAESLVGDLVGTFGTPNVGEVDPAGTTFSQGTPTTAMESASMMSGIPQRSSVLQDDGVGGGQHHHHHHIEHETMDDLDGHNSIDGMAMSASVSSHLVVSPGASVSGSAVSVTANPPSEIIGRIEPAPQLLIMDELEAQQQSPAPPASVVVAEDLDRNMMVGAGGGHQHHAEHANAHPHLNQATVSQQEHMNVMSMPQLNDQDMQLPTHSLQAQDLPVREEIVNRRIRPGMVNLEQYAAVASAASPSVSLHVSPMPRSRPLADNMIGGGPSLIDTPTNARNVEEFDFDKEVDLPMTPRSLMSDSLHDLPGDELWTSPTAKMSVSPIHRSNNAVTTNLNRRKSSSVDRLLMVPSMAPTSTMTTRAQDTVPVAPTEEGAANSHELSQLAEAFNCFHLNHSSAVESKRIESYCRHSPLSKALQTRLLPLLVTGLIEIPVMLTMARSDRLCAVLGQEHHRLLLGFVPVLAAISGTFGLQSSQLTTTAILHGQVSAATVQAWVYSECQVSLFVGAGMGVFVGLGSLLFYSTSAGIGRNLVFALVLGIAQTISAVSAGCAGSVSPLLLSWLLKGNARVMNGVLERAVQDAVTVLLSTSTCILWFLLLTSPLDSAADGCMVA